MIDISRPSDRYGELDYGQAKNGHPLRMIHTSDMNRDELQAVQSCIAEPITAPSGESEKNFRTNDTSILWKLADTR